MSQHLKSGVLSPLLAPIQIEVPRQQQLLGSTSEIAINIAMGDKMIDRGIYHQMTIDDESIIVTRQPEND